MADQTITPREFTMPTQFIEMASGDYEDLTSSNDGICLLPKDGKFLLNCIDAAGGATVTITADDTTALYETGGIKGSQGHIDSSDAAALGGTAAVMTINLHNFAVLESSRFKWLKNDDGIISGDTGMMGRIRIKTDQNIKAACIVLP